MNNPSVVPVRGEARSGFEPLVDIFGRLLAARGIGGAALCIYRDGKPVVDLVAGAASQNDLQLVFSVSKAITAIALHSAVEDGLIDLSEPLSSTWPELSRASTRKITLQHVLSHRSGLEGLDGFFDVSGFWSGADVDRISVQEPHWEPGTAHGYHAVTYGTLVRGTLERQLGQSVTQLVRGRLTGPLGLDLWFGDFDEAAAARYVPVQFAPPMSVDSPKPSSALPRPSASASTADALLAALLRDPQVFNSCEFLNAQIPSMNAVTNARSLARLFASTIGEVDGTRILSDRTLSEMTAAHSCGFDVSLGIESAFGLGMQLPFPQLPMVGPHSFGHEGAGGSLAFADPSMGISVGFTTDVFPALAGASPVILGMLPTIGLLASRS